MKLGSKIVVLALIGFAAPMFAQSAGITLTGGKHDTTLPVEVTADSLALDQSSGSATFEGTARVGQGSLRLGADKIVVNYDQNGSAIASVQATGNVVFTNGVDMAEAGSASYIVSSGMLIMKGNVLLVQGATAISGDRMDLNILANTAKVSGSVKTVLTPK
jgi:lipopolysaccharide export system protein LptA